MSLSSLVGPTGPESDAQPHNPNPHTAKHIINTFVMPPR